MRPPFIKMRHLDLFSGIGGFALAAQWMGWETVGFCEKENYAKRVLGRHWPNVPIVDDIRDIKEPIGCDIITGGFPCQPFSVAGKQKSKADDRYLWPEMLRVIALERPAWVVGENVAGIVGLALDQTLSDLEAQSYSSRAFILPACAVDAPHRRDRVWIVAHSGRKPEGSQAQPKRSPSHPARCSRTFDAASNRVAADRHDAGRIKQRRSIAASPEHKATECTSKWASEPSMGRVAYGVPNRVDRVKALGNAIVPQVAYKLFQAIHNDHSNFR